MSEQQLFNGRKAVAIENAHLRVVVLEGGGHIAAVVDKVTGISPLWVPPWQSIEPSAYGPADHEVYGAAADGRLLAGIMGHNLCLDIFGGPSDAEAAAGLTAHGEGSVAPYRIERGASRLTMRAELPMVQLRIERQLDLIERSVRVRETVENLMAVDRPIGWTEHVTLGPPFLEHGITEFRASAGRSQVFAGTFGPADYLQPGAVFDWPHAPAAAGGAIDLRRYTGAAVSSAYTAHLMEPQRQHAFFVAFSPVSSLAFGYVWNTADFPWMGIWEENRSRTHAPWNGRTVTRGMEFGVSPIPETRREMVDRGRLFDTPTYRWIPARTRIAVEYWIVCRRAAAVPESLEWPA